MHKDFVKRLDVCCRKQFLKFEQKKKPNNLETEHGDFGNMTPHCICVHRSVYILCTFSFELLSKGQG